jgi:hypothetical protein
MYRGEIGGKQCAGAAYAGDVLCIAIDLVDR